MLNLKKDLRDEKKKADKDWKEVYKEGVTGKINRKKILKSIDRLLYVDKILIEMGEYHLL